MNSLIIIIQQIYTALGITQSANSGDLFGIFSILILLAGASFFIFSSPKTPDVVKEAIRPEKIVQAPQNKVDAETTPVISWVERLKKGLGQSRSEVWGRFGAIFSGGKLDADKLEELEELLYSSDMGPEMVSELIEEVTESMEKQEMNLEGFKTYLYDFLDKKIGDVQTGVNTELYEFKEGSSNVPKVIMVVGVNGAGKTTTIGKLATKLKKQGAKVVVGACDTFRAAAVDQLEVWCKRADVEMIRAKEGTNPSGVGYDALQTAINSNADYCILDTAGRLHTKENLMEELKKMKRVLLKLDENAPHEVLLVIDAVTGQNAMRQAEEFNQALKLTGLIFTKCDGSSKAGGAVGIIHKLRVPITYIGVGESVDDLNIFKKEEYLSALLDMEV